MKMDETQTRPGSEASRLTVFYDLYRDARLNFKYYGHRLDWYMRWNRNVDIVIALGAFFTFSSISSAEVAADAGWLKALGIALAFVTAALAVIKPFIELPKSIQRYSELHAGYKSVHSDLKLVFDVIRSAESVPGDLDRTIREARETIKRLELWDDPKPKRKLREAFYAEVSRELPESELWLPVEAA